MDLIVFLSCCAMCMCRARVPCGPALVWVNILLCCCAVFSVNSVVPRPRVDDHMAGRSGGPEETYISPEQVERAREAIRILSSIPIPDSSERPGPSRSTTPSNGRQSLYSVVYAVS